MKLGEISNHFDLRGEVAIASMSPQEELARHEMRRSDPMDRGPFYFIEKKIPKPQTGQSHFLDLCCGTGKFSIFPAYLGYKIEGVDISEKSIRAARARLRCHGFLDATDRFAVDDAVKYLEGIEEKFDVIQCIGSCYYLTGTNILESIERALKPGGIFIGVETSGMNLVSSWVRQWRNKRLRHRDEMSLHHLLRKEDFVKMSEHFDSFEIESLDFLSFFGLIGFWLPRLGSVAFSVGQFLDKVVLSVPGLSRLAFRIGFVARKAQRRAS